MKGDLAAPSGRRLGLFGFGLIYLLLMLSAISVAIMITLLPLVARTAHIPDVQIIMAQAGAAGSWIFVAGFWSRLAQKRGRKTVILIGGIGLCLGCAATGGGIWLAVMNIVAPMAALAVLLAARVVNGTVGLAAVPAAQAFVIERTDVRQRAVVMSSLSSAQALGTIVGPAIAPFMTHIPGLGLAAPMIIVAALCGLAVPVLASALPNDRQNAEPGPKAVENDIGAQGVWHMKAMRGYLAYSLIMATAATGLIQTIGFLILDTVKVSPDSAQLWVGQAIAAGAMSTLAAQLIFTPLFKPSPRGMMLAAPILAALGLALLCVLPGYWLIVVATIVANAGFAVARPGVGTAASLALPLDRQTELAAALLSTVSGGVVIGPVMAITLYSIWKPLPFVVLAVTQCAALVIALRCGQQRIATTAGTSNVILD